LLSAVDQRRLDVAFVRTAGGPFTSLQSHVLHDEDFVAVIPRGHALSKSTAPLKLSALKHERLVLYRRRDGVGLFDVLMTGFAAAGIMPNVAEEVPRIIAAINLVAAGQGISLVPESMRVVHAEAVIYRRLMPRALPPMPLRLVYRSDDRTALVRNFIEIARETAHAATQ
jgi:DNA-binding transcriptional LysR family regulator